MKFLFFLLFVIELHAINIINKPIAFDETRVALTKAYILEHYNLRVINIEIIPRIIVVHWTALNDFNISYHRFSDTKLPQDRAQIQKASSLNVSTHFMIDRDGTIYQLMPETRMGRHVIGLNYSAIGIENVGGKDNIDNLTPEQLQANIDLIEYLHNKHPSISTLIGHHEYTQCTTSPLWLEHDKNYRTVKYDPGEPFMHKLRLHFPNLQNCSSKAND